MEYDVLIIGAGISGAIVARRYAELGKKSLILEKRANVAGNLFDYKDRNGIIIHKFGPHIFQTSDNIVIDYVKQFATWSEFRHQVNAKINGIEVPLPINFTSIDLLFPVKAEEIKKALRKDFKDQTVTNIFDLLKSKNNIIKRLAEFINKNVYENYSVKMWGIEPSEIDESVLKRVPIRLSYDDGYFSDTFQAVPTKGFTEFINSILDSNLITVKKNLNAMEDILLKNGKVYYKGEVWDKPLIWTGPIDELFSHKFGTLEYRSLHFEVESYDDVNLYQVRPVVNYPADPKMTRITEYKQLSQQMNVEGLFMKTAIGKEFPGQYNKKSKLFNEPYYPVLKKNVSDKIQKYFKEAKKYENITLIGRLAEYKYKQMWMAISDALKVKLD